MQKRVGFFDVDKPEYILGKLEVDYQRVIRSPADRQAFMDFINTANMLLTWAKQTKQHGLTSLTEPESVLLDVCRELANNLKHWHKKTTLVSDTVFGSVFDFNVFDPALFDTGQLRLKLRDGAKKHLGEDMTTDAFARKIIEFWRAHL